MPKPLAFAARVLTLMAGTAVVAAAQSAAVPMLRLTRGVEFPEAFSSVGGLHELPNGELLFLDRQEKRIVRLDFASGRVSDAARQGSGPLEFAPTGGFVRSPADRPLFQDIQQTRLLRFDAAGRPTGTVSLGSGMEAMMAMGAMLYADTAGRVYSLLRPMRMPSPRSGTMPTGQMTLDDSMTVVRFLPGDARRDTVLRVRSPLSGTNTRYTTTPTLVTARTTVPDGRSHDVFTFLRDGRIAVLSGSEYRVRFIGADGRETRGPLVPSQARPITAAMQRAAVDSMRAQMARAKVESDKQRAEMLQRIPAGVDLPLPRTEFIVEAPERWQPELPRWAALSSDGLGRLWVAVPSDLLGALAHIDILSPAGALLARLEPPRDESMAGYTSAWVYTTRTDADGLVYLKRYPMPALR